MQRFGAPTLAWETRLDYPHLWGTRRIGPDLARAGGTRTSDWHYAHLFAPRTVVPDSVMPAYRALFDGAPDRPRQEARDLVAYLETLGRARELAGPEGEAHAREACNCPDDEMAQMAFDGAAQRAPGARAAHARGAGAAARQRPGRAGSSSTRATAPPATAPAATATARARRPCCRGPPTWRSTTTRWRASSDVLWNGVAGTAMPAWRDHSADDRAAIAQAVRALAPRGVAEPELPAHLVEIGERVYAANCAQCHGERGDGGGPAAESLPMAPASFRRQRPTLAHSLRVLRNGIEGTSMAPWTSRLSDAELLAVAHYVRSFYAGVVAPGDTGR